MSGERNVDGGGGSLSSSETVWLDKIVGDIVESWAEEADLSLELLLLPRLVTNSCFNCRPGSVSAVDCLLYLLVNLARVESGEEEVGEEVAAALRCSARDLAASHYRLLDRLTGDMETLQAELQVSLASCSEDLPAAYQAQCDFSFLAALLGQFQLFRASKASEVRLLLKLNNFHEAQLKIVYYGIFTDGLQLFSDLLESAAIDSFDKIFGVRSELFVKYLDFLDDQDNQRNGLKWEVERDRERATILVDPCGQRGYIDGKFHVLDLPSALKLAQNGGTIFLEDGEYKTNTFFDVIQKNEDDPFKIINIIGASTNECSIHGTIKVTAKQKVTFKRIKLEVGSTPECGDAMHLTCGRVELQGCLVEATVNTLWVLQAGAALQAQFCVVDGLESCQRMISLQGSGCSLELGTCWARDAFSLVTVLGGAELADATLALHNCQLDGLQTGLQLSTTGPVSVSLTATSLGLVLYDQEDCAAAVALTTETNTDTRLQARNNNIVFQHVDGKGFDLNNCSEARIERTRMRTVDEVDRKLAVCEGVSAVQVSRLTVDQSHITGFRLAVRTRQVNELYLARCTVERCAVGLMVGAGHLGPAPLLQLTDCRLATVYYGVMGEEDRARLSLSHSTFTDIPKPLLLCPGMVDSLQEKDCQYLLSRAYTDPSSSAATLEAEMNLYLATSENLPHRIAYEKEELQLIHKFSQLGYSQ